MYGDDSVLIQDRRAEAEDDFTITLTTPGTTQFLYIYTYLYDTTTSWIELTDQRKQVTKLFDCGNQCLVVISVHSRVFEIIFINF
eukprot:UN27517